MTIATATHKPSSTTIASADSADYALVEGNVYFPPSSLKIDQSQLEVTKTHTTCPWKGVASYYTITLEDGTKIKDAAWFYPEPKSGAANIKDFIAFCEFCLLPSMLKMLLLCFLVN
jgi:uncharacterized protein (DUF427 family)